MPELSTVPAAGVVAEAMVALVLADAFLEKFGGDSVAESARNERDTSANVSSPRCFASSEVTHGPKRSVDGDNRVWRDRRPPRQSYT